MGGLFGSGGSSGRAKSYESGDNNQKKPPKAVRPDFENMKMKDFQMKETISDPAPNFHNMTMKKLRKRGNIGSETYGSSLLGRR